MPALNFQRRFADIIKLGAKALHTEIWKTQTIRPERKYPIKQYDTLYLYTGMRTKKCEKLGEVICKRIMPICIEEWGFKLITRIGKEEHWKDSIDPLALQWFAVRDGFQNWPEMREWFKKRYGLPFEGVLIEW